MLSLFHKGGLRGILTEGSISSLMVLSLGKHFNEGIVFRSIGVLSPSSYEIGNKVPNATDWRRR